MLDGVRCICSSGSLDVRRECVTGCSFNALCAISCRGCSALVPIRSRLYCRTPVGALCLSALAKQFSPNSQAVGHRMGNTSHESLDAAHFVAGWVVAVVRIHFACSDDRPHSVRHLRRAVVPLDSKNGANLFELLTVRLQHLSTTCTSLVGVQ